MRRKRVGYFAGTDSTLLTSLILDGYDTIPVSNGFDNHGKHIRLFNEVNKVDLLIGYLHKIYAPAGAQITYQDIFHICKTYQMPLLLEVPKDLHEAARSLLEDIPKIVQFVDPEEMLEAARQILAG